MNQWEMFSEMCRLVVEQQNCCLEIIINDDVSVIHLIPISFYEEDDEEGEL